MCLESQRLDKQIKSLQAQLKTFPDGDFYCTKNGKYYKWYRVVADQTQLITKEFSSLAEKLAIKKYENTKDKNEFNYLKAEANYIQTPPIF